MNPLASSLPAVPRLVTSLPGPRASQWIERDARLLSPSYTRDYPLVAQRGWGAMIEDVDGNVFLDFTAGLAVNSTGQAHPLVAAAIAEQAQQLIHMSGTDFYYPAEIELAERLAALPAGDAPRRVFFTNSGTEAVEAAVKLARYHTGRSRLIAFEGAFHGRTCGSLSLSGSKAVHQRGFGPLLAGVHRLPFNCSAAQLERLFNQEAPPDEVAAVIVEPVQGEGGYRVARPGFLGALRDACDRHGMLLVVDEIQSGIGRTGRMLACEHFGIGADVICLAKGLASGMPLGAVIAPAAVMNWPPGSHASTFGGNPVCCRAALATLELVEQQYLANVEPRGHQLQAGLEQLQAEFAFLSGARGLGLMRAVDVLGRGRPDPQRRARLIDAAFRRGLLLVGCGASAIRFCPALCVTAPQIDAGLRILGESCEAESSRGRRRGD